MFTFWVKAIYNVAQVNPELDFMNPPPRYCLPGGGFGALSGLFQVLPSAYNVRAAARNVQSCWLEG